MKVIKLKISNISLTETNLNCSVSDENNFNRLEYSIENKSIRFSEENSLSQSILANKFQFDKVISSAIKGNISAEKTINCIFLEDYNFLQSNDYLNYIRIDRRTNELLITTSDKETLGINKVYADGSFLEKLNKSGFGGFVEYSTGEKQIFQESFINGSSNLMELLAVTKGLELLQHEQQIQVNTDSRFVIRGLVQWVHFWRHNNWQTAFGNSVKFAKEWKYIDQLCENKLIEFKWIKGHSDNIKQDFCHQLAKESAQAENKKI